MFGISGLVLERGQVESVACYGLNLRSRQVRRQALGEFGFGVLKGLGFRGLGFRVHLRVQVSIGGSGLRFRVFFVVVLSAFENRWLGSRYVRKIRVQRDSSCLQRFLPRPA